MPAVGSAIFVILAPPKSTVPFASVAVLVVTVILVLAPLVIVNESVPLPDIPALSRVTVSPTFTPSLPMVVFVTTGCVPAAAPAGTGCVFVTVMPSLPMSTFVIGFVVSVSFAIDVMPTKSFAKPISRRVTLFSVTCLVKIFFAAVAGATAGVP